MRTALTAALTLTILMVTASEGAEVRELIAKLKDTDNEARRAAAKELGELGSEAKSAVPDLARALSDEDLFVRRFAAEALGKVGPAAKTAVPQLALAMGDQKKEVQLAAVEALAKVGPDAIAALTSAVKDPNKDAAVRKKAAQGLASIGLQARSAVPALTDILTGKIRSPKAAKKKGKDLEDSDIRIDAAIALGSVAKPEDKAAVEALKSFTDAKQRNRSLKKAATESLRKINGQAPAKKKKKKDD